MQPRTRYRFPKTILQVTAAVILLNVTCLTGFSMAPMQDEPVDPDFYFSCVQDEKDFNLKVKMSHWDGERDIPIGGATVVFSNPTGDPAGDRMEALATVQTDIYGEAAFSIEKGSGRLEDEEGNYTFRAVFDGNRDYAPSDDMVTVRPLYMHLTFTEVDTVKTIVAEAFETDPGGNQIPLEETDVYFYVPRTFSLLPVGSEWFMEGQAQAGFPTTLPGDSAGNLTIIARIEDHELYGNVEASAVKDWGLAIPRIVVQKRRGLGDTDAPLWMVYTLIVLLSAVWFHYLYVFYVMIKIKRLRRN